MKAGDVCEIVQGEWPLDVWGDDASLIGQRVTLMSRHTDKSYWNVDASESAIHERALRPIPPRDDLRTVSWDKCHWKPAGIRA